MQKGFTSPRILELKKKKKKAIRNKVLFFIGLILILSTLFVLFTRWKEININSLDISGNKILDDENIRKVVEKNLEGYYLWFIPKSNTFLYPKRAIQKELKEKFKRIEDLNIDVVNNQILKVYVKERKAVYTWCGESIESFGVSEHLDISTSESVLDKCYFLNEDGYIFDKAPYFSGEVYFRFFGKLIDQKDTTNPVGSYFEPEIFNKILFLKDNIASLNLDSQAFVSKENGDLEFYLSSKNSLKDSPKIIFKREADYVKLAENLHSAITSEPLSTSIKEKYNTLNYIDLRFGNKIYYKFK